MNPLILLTQCAPLIAPVTLAAVVQHESSGHPYAIHDNATGETLILRTSKEATETASARIALGHSVDLGLGQINSRNLASLGVDVRQMFEPCANLRAAQSILLSSWTAAAGSLPRTFSAYNTGRTSSTVGARYAQAVYAQARASEPVVPAIEGAQMPTWTRREVPDGTDDTAPGNAAAMRTAGTALPPVRVRLIPSPQASGLVPDRSELSPDIGSKSQ